jgi:hypothetical protein
MKFRKLRITWTVFCVIAAVLVIVLWVRSCCYLTTDIFTFAPTTSLNLRIGTALGAVQVQWQDRTLSYWQTGIRSFTWSGMVKPQIHFFRILFRFQHGPDRLIFSLFYPLLLGGALALAPWIRYISLRFSLRTLLIATTLVAVLLGLVVSLVQ